MPSKHNRPDGESDRIQPGEAAEIYRLHHERLLGILQASLSIPLHVAEDACGHAWVQLVRYRPRRATVFSWLYTVASRAAFDLLGRSSRELPGADVSGVESAFDIEQLIDDRDALRRLAELRPIQRRVIELRAQGYSYTAIEETLGLSSRQVRRHATEGRQALRRLIEQP
jgi:RNA polymerase sigma factor (sigma-70 family)